VPAPIQLLRLHARMTTMLADMIDPQRTVASVVLDHSECAAVFQRHRIDYCCRGNLSVAAACEKHGIPTDALLAELAGAIAERDPRADVDVRTLSTAELVERIVERHHTYLRKTLPFVGALAEKVARVHGEREPRLREVASIVRELSDVLLPHLDDEERHLFPHLLAEPLDAELVRKELVSMRDEHMIVGGLLGRLHGIADGYGPPEWACNSYRTLMQELAGLESDVLVHVHLENHELLPRFIAATASA